MRDTVRLLRSIGPTIKVSFREWETLQETRLAAMEATDGLSVQDRCSLSEGAHYAQGYLRVFGRDRDGSLVALVRCCYRGGPTLYERRVRLVPRTASRDTPSMAMRKRNWKT